MSSVDEVFRQMQTFAEGEETIDSNNYCMLESDTTRKILIPEKYSIFGVESDEKTNLIKFAFPKAVNNIKDLSQYSLRFNYMNAVGNTDQCLAQNIEVQGDYVTFDWLLTRNVTRYQGNISFIVCAVTTNEEDGTITNEWNTTLATAQSLEGLETVPTPGEEQIARDLLTELLVSLNNSKNNAITEITQTKTKAISDIETEGQTQTEAVDAKGAQVLESIPDDYTTLENRVDELEQNRAYVIIGNGSGEFVTLNDSSELKTRNVKLFGKSVQAETTGVQLFDINTAKNYDEAEITDYSSGTMEIEQNNSAMTQSPKLKEWCPTMQAGQSYLLTCETTSTKKYITIGSSQWDFGGIFIPSADDLEENVEWHCTTQRSTAGDIVYYRDTFAGIMIVEGSSEKPYEVYTGGEAATEPTPDYPLPITSAGNYDDESEKYEVGIGVTGKNLFDASKLPTKTQNGATVTNNGDGSFTVSGSGNITGFYQSIYDYTHEETIKMLSVGDLSLSEDSNTEPYMIAQLKISKSTNIGDTILQLERGETKQITKEMLMNPKSFLRVQIFGGNDRPIIPGTIKPVLYQEGNGTFEPFKQQLSTLQIPNPLRGVPVDSGGNYTDADGQQWICDYIDRERGKYVQCVQEIVFDGSNDEVWNYSGKCVFVEINDYNRFGQIEALCDCFKYDTWENVSMGYANNCYTVFQYNTWTRLRIAFFKTDIGNNVQEFKSWLQSNPVTVLYRVDEPIETDLTPDQLSALNLSTYQGITNIGTDTMPQAGIDVEYIADTKTYIDNAIAEAIATIPTE